MRKFQSSLKYLLHESVYTMDWYFKSMHNYFLESKASGNRKVRMKISYQYFTYYTMESFQSNKLLEVYNLDKFLKVV